MTFSNPGAIADVSNGGSLDPAWGNAIRDRVVNTFATTTDRDAAITSPHEGQFAYVTADHTAYVHNGVAWRPMPWQAPWGVIGYAQATGNQGTFTAATDITSLTLTWTAVANRRYKTLATCVLSSSVATDVGVVSITDGTGTNKQQAQGTLTNGLTLAPWVIETPAAGSTTRKVQARRLSGSGNITNNASATQPSQILVEDIGPNGSPA